MSHFEVLILPIDKVVKHPNADRLSLNHIRGYVAVSNRLDDGSHRYKPGQLVAYVPLGAEVPNSLLKARGYWDHEKDKGYLGGPGGNIVTAINLRGVVSRGLIFPTELMDGDSEYDFTEYPYIRTGEGHMRLVREGEDVSRFLDIGKHEELFATRFPQREIGYRGLSAVPITYEIEDLKKYPALLKDKWVTVSELLHGILCVVGFDRRLDDPFFVASGPMANEGFCYSKDAENVYTKVAVPIWEEIKRYLVEMPAVEKFYIFGEIIGPGIQDITYGLDKIEFRALDVQMGLMGGGIDSIPFGFIATSKKYQLFKWMNLMHAPLIWGMQFDPEKIEELTNGPSSIGGGIRKGVIVTTEDESLIGGRRPILKNIADKYLLRTKGTEFK